MRQTSCTKSKGVVGPDGLHVKLEPARTGRPISRTLPCEAFHETCFYILMSVGSMKIQAFYLQSHGSDNISMLLFDAKETRMTSR